ncbi:NAD(P)/FAD-dependent oxidoreductase [Amycolatopsis sp., V23-08]|uniref:Flavin-dependent monooxygenase n=1 Tax=Amycolatopsis heterodermiae TaxID=3110235 RepID=A0ABU5RKT6_9PSEU|nr:NAD(P)/FAD-dependent oxidoreductase [Amycolatopsis sp., V23-08]MEA5366798.1 NAD(P)/FAD-dependent oxidoreductase [Amycolatopsis sp., V23-08]
MSSPSVTIVGAGLSGLVLARILQNHGVSATVHELDVSPGVRRQGGSLDIHEETGQLALREAGLYDEFRRHTHPQGEHVRVLDKNAHVHVDTGPEGGEGGRPEIDRTVLRSLLLDSLDPGRIVWDHKVTAVRALGGGRHELTFRDGSTTETDLLVGADGTWSKVRPLLSPATPEYCGVTHLELLVPDATAKHPELAELVGPGMVFALSDNKGFLGHGGDDLELGASLRVPEDWLDAADVDWADPGAAREALLGAFADWAPVFHDLIRSSSDTITPRRIFGLPAGHRWERVPGVTLVGDAAHVMSPYAGEGANLALIDGADLARAILEHPDDLETALARYETAMFPRAENASLESAQGLASCFTPTAPVEIAGFFSQMAAHS